MFDFFMIIHYQKNVREGNIELITLIFIFIFTVIGINESLTKMRNAVLSEREKLFIILILGSPKKL